MQTPLTTVVSSTLGSAFNTSEGHRRIICRSGSLVSPPPTLSFVAGVALSSHRPSVPPHRHTTNRTTTPSDRRCDSSPPLFSLSLRLLVSHLANAPFCPSLRCRFPISAPYFSARCANPLLSTSSNNSPASGPSCSVTVDICTRLTSPAPLSVAFNHHLLFFLPPSSLISFLFFPSCLNLSSLPWRAATWVSTAVQAGGPAEYKWPSFFFCAFPSSGFLQEAGKVRAGFLKWCACLCCTYCVSSEAQAGAPLLLDSSSSSSSSSFLLHMS